MTDEARAAVLPEDIAGVFSLDGRRAIVTGAASGLGRAIALGFAHFGAGVACLDIDLEGAEKTADEVSALGREGYAVRVD
ncbi:MAG TPA: SDR family NAD(P)-dependent oxidoreductase, partial [Rubrobacter sp.]|nr:SDR family NAD(P)-dependent oxidoreductase [Rubrobacter sp.]